MRKIRFQMLVTLDGFYQGPNGEIDWHTVDEEFNEYAINNLNQVDTLIFGRVTYELMASYWPTPAAIKDDPIVAAQMNQLSKIVFSRTLEHVDWNNTRLIKGNIVGEVSKLKQQSGKDIAIFGSSDLSLSLIKNDLIDEYAIFIVPTVLGEGKPLFKGIQEKLHLKLLKTKVFRNGLVALIYERAK